MEYIYSRTHLTLVSSKALAIGMNVTPLSAKIFFPGLKADVAAAPSPRSWRDLTTIVDS